MKLSFRNRLLLTMTLIVTLAVVAVAWVVQSFTSSAFDRFNQERTSALASQFRREFDRTGEDIARRLEIIANSEPVLRMAGQLSQPSADSSPYVGVAQEMASLQQLDLLEVLAADGTIISSAQWPARFGYKEDWIADLDTAQTVNIFLGSEQLPQDRALAVEALRTISFRGNKFFLVGGRRIDERFLRSLSAPEGLRAFVVTWPSQSSREMKVIGQISDATASDKLMPLISRGKESHREVSDRIDWSNNPTESEDVRAVPLAGREGNPLAALVIASSRTDLVQLNNRMRKASILIVAAGILAAILASVWVGTRITRPVQQLALAAQQVAKGDWNSRVEISSDDEIGELARAFNQMTGELVSHRERLVQSERVAAWRELARRLAHELKNPLFPLQITVENLLRAKKAVPQQFDEVFDEGVNTLLAEIAHLQAIIGRFSDFSKMPAPEMQNLDLNQLVREVVPLFRAQLPGRESGRLTIETHLDADLPIIRADPVLMRRVLENLMLNALDVMPDGGTLTVTTGYKNGNTFLDVSDTGTGLTPEECERLFTPYYTTKQKGTGLGLAIVQSVISDHRGKISVTSEKQRGTTFHIELRTSKAENGHSNAT